MRTVLLILAMLACLVAVAFGFEIVSYEGTPVDAILRSIGWLSLGGALYVGSHLVGDWP